MAAYGALGAVAHEEADAWIVDGMGGSPSAPKDVIDVGNSGTSLRLAVGSAALLSSGMAVLTGDEQIRRRPAGPLLSALCDLGAWAVSTRGNGSAPIVVRGRLQGGETSIECQTSQYLTSLLINAPLADGDTLIYVPLLNEVPYVDMTLGWLSAQHVDVERDGHKEFRVRGGHRYEPFDRRIPSDFSSATFFLCAGALGDNDVTVGGLDLADTQGDKAVLDYLRRMGVRVDIGPDGVRVRPGDLKGCEIDLNATPDALPMMAVVGCFAAGETRLVNVPQARIKETDRIAVMCQELKRLGARMHELPDGLVVEHSELTPAEVDGHGDHRVAMALTVVACSIPGGMAVKSAESVAVTFPAFRACMGSLGAQIEAEQV